MVVIDKNRILKIVVEEGQEEQDSEFESISSGKDDSSEFSFVDLDDEDKSLELDGDDDSNDSIELDDVLDMSSTSSVTSDYADIAEELEEFENTPLFKRMQAKLKVSYRRHVSRRSNRNRSNENSGNGDGGSSRPNPDDDKKLFVFEWTRRAIRSINRKLRKYTGVKWWIMRAVTIVQIMLVIFSLGILEVIYDMMKGLVSSMWNWFKGTNRNDGRGENAQLLRSLCG